MRRAFRRRSASSCWRPARARWTACCTRYGFQVRRSRLTRPGSLLRQQIPIRGSVWEDNKPGGLEVDTVALRGGNVAGDYVWMLEAVDYATTWVSIRAMWNRGREGTLAALADLEQCLPFPLLGLDSDNGGEFLNYHVLAWLQERSRPVFMTRSRPYKRMTTPTSNKRTGPMSVSGSGMSAMTTMKWSGTSTHSPAAH